MPIAQKSRDQPGSDKAAAAEDNNLHNGHPGSLRNIILARLRAEYFRVAVVVLVVLLWIDFVQYDAGNTRSGTLYLLHSVSKNFPRRRTPGRDHDREVGLCRQDRRARKRQEWRRIDQDQIVAVMQVLQDG